MKPLSMTLKSKLQSPNEIYKKNKRLVKNLAAVILCAANLHAIADSTEPAIPLTVDSVNFSARDFFSTYMSKSAEDRKIAEIYLLGVMDSTEGKSWCSYSLFKTVTLRERVYLGMKTLPQDQLSTRASSAIEKILSDRYPCRSQK